MKNMHILYDNAVKRALLTASSEVATLPALNLLDERKGQVWRSAGGTATLTLTWNVGEPINMVCLPFTNFTTAATMRVRGYTNTGDSMPLFDTGTGLCCRGAVDPADWGDATSGANTFAYGGGAYAVRYFTGGTVKKLVIDLADATVGGYLEAAHLLCGTYWSPTYNPDYGMKVTYLENSKSDRNDAGDLVTIRGIKAKRLSFNLSLMPEADRNKMMSILRWNGMFKPIFISVFPEDASATREEAYQLLGKLSQMSAISLDSFSRFSQSLDIEEI